MRRGEERRGEEAINKAIGKIILNNIRLKYLGVLLQYSFFLKIECKGSQHLTGICQCKFTLKFKLDYSVLNKKSDPQTFLILLQFSNLLFGGGGVCHLPKGFFFSKNGRGLGFSDTKGR